MREIKFRAWTKDQRMIYNVVPFQWDYCINTMWHRCLKSNGPGISGAGGTEATFEVGGYSIIDGAIMQFTGLKDKNGKEIYEGDILCWPEYEGKKHQSRWVIEWDDEKAEYTKWHPKNKAEVIGNIYENPELVTPK